MSELSLARISPTDAEWDALVREFPGRTLFHESAWHHHLRDIHPAGQMQYFEIRQGRQRVGIHCGLRITKLGLPIHGSPLGGTGTNYMGPLVYEHVAGAALGPLMRSLLGPRHGLHLEVSHFRLAPEGMLAAGFDRHESVTHLIRLPDSEEAAWAMLKSPCRNRVRKAQQFGLEVRTASDASVANRFFDQFIEVYGKQGMQTPFGIERPQSLYRHLAPAGRLLPLEVWHEGRVLASGLFPFDDHCIYFWGAGSWLREQHLCPNELLHWEVIRFAVQRSLAAYNMCGGRSQFKDKFGGEDVPYVTYSKSALPGLRYARDVYRRLHFMRLKTGASAVPVPQRPVAQSAPSTSE